MPTMPRAAEARLLVTSVEGFLADGAEECTASELPGVEVDVCLAAPCSWALS
jgi:hypothetical protein